MLLTLLRCRGRSHRLARALLGAPCVYNRSRVFRTEPTDATLQLASTHHHQNQVEPRPNLPCSKDISCGTLAGVPSIHTCMAFCPCSLGSCPASGAWALVPRHLDSRPALGARAFCPCPCSTWQGSRRDLGVRLLQTDESERVCEKLSPADK